MSRLQLFDMRAQYCQLHRESLSTLLLTSGLRIIGPDDASGLAVEHTDN